MKQFFIQLIFFVDNKNILKKNLLIKPWVCIFFIIIFQIPSVFLSAQSQFLSLGGLYGAGVKKLVVDSQGNSYLTGFMTEEIKLGEILLKERDGKYFLTKINKNSEIQWAKSLQVPIQDMAILGDTNIILAGQFKESFNFDNQELTPKSNFDVFLLSLNENGKLRWQQQINGNSETLVKSITTDKNGNIYITGNFTGTTKFSKYILQPIHSKNIYIAKYNAQGEFDWVRQASGGTNLLTGIHVWKIITHQSDHITIVGTITGQANFGKKSLTSSHELFYGEGWVYNADIFATQYSASGEVVWVKNMGTNADVTDIATDKENNIYLTGFIRGSQNLSNKPKFGLSIFGKVTIKINPTTSLQALETVFFAKYSNAGNITWAKTIKGRGTSRGTKILYNHSTDNIWLCGFFKDILKENENILRTETQKSDIFLALIDTNGKVQSLTQGQGEETEEVTDAFIDKNEELFIVGRFKKTLKIYDFLLQTDGNSTNGFWAKIKMK
ncbi:MAG: hypothetical protein EAZ85_00385 [Bacteroidetes bacterium]|nr:MAG: hypothetical protein EAZ85_00385 [Bacteroidota bacterium]TAG90325.1 MAG: hypothetical protein EAZ20_04580 [Bacteroidota bacterium]